VIPIRGESSTTPRRTQDYITRLAVRKRNAPNVNEEATVDAGIERRKAFLGLLFPLTIAVGANAPFLYVMANPPSAEERDTMLMDFCKGDVCTLLGGGWGWRRLRWWEAGGEYAHIWGVWGYGCRGRGEGERVELEIHSEELSSLRATL